MPAAGGTEVNLGQQWSQKTSGDRAMTSVVPANEASESLSVGRQHGHGPKEHGSRVPATGETGGSKFRSTTEANLR